MEDDGHPLTPEEEDPLDATEDHPLHVSEQVLEGLRLLRAGPKFTDATALKPEERDVIAPMIDAILDELIAGLAAHPTKRWVLERFQPRLMALELDDTEVREPFGGELWEIMKVVGIESSDGLIAHYLQ